MRVPQPPPRASLASLVGRGTLDLDRILAVGPVDAKGRYLHWDQMRHRRPPNGLSLDEWWIGTSLSRRALARSMPLVDAGGRPFTFANVDAVQEKVHRIDQLAGGQILADDVVTSLRGSDRYLVSSLAEEAITSSQLEGASTTRRVAKELLATGRAPRDRSEQMIVNNFQAMIAAQEMAAVPFTPDRVLDLHRTIAEDAVDDPRDAGRLQSEGEDRIAIYWHDGTLLHQSPPAEQLEARLTELCAFANGETPDGFLHPVVRAIMLHFWLAYDHPFVDGNGRTARALFYWAMLRSGYWLAQYISVSAILRGAPRQYVDSYLYTETDSGDITYFVLYQLDVILRAVDSLNGYLGRKMAETQEIERLLQGSGALNHRQLLVVRDALRDPSEPFTIAAQARRNRVTYESARTDLAALERLDLLTKVRQGKKYVYRTAPDLPARLRNLGDAVRSGR